MRIRACACCLLLANVAIIGCGRGSMSMEELKRRAIRRPGGDEQTSAPPPPVAEAKTNGGSSDGGPAATGAADGTSETSAPVEILLPTGVTAKSTPSPVQAPAEPLGREERFRRAIENLTRIGEAISRYQQEKSHFPLPTIKGPDQKPALSWRVELLPYLGYGDLYRQFHLDERWDSPHNQQLLERIPPEFQSPERFDHRTNYLVPVGSLTVYPGDRHITRRHVEDGLPHTAVLLEVDDDGAVPWTQPADHEFDPRSPGARLGQLREGRFLVVWGDGKPASVPRDLDESSLKAMFTIDSGERFAANVIGKPPEAILATEVATETTEAQPEPGVETAASGGERATTRTTASPSPRTGGVAAAGSPDSGTNDAARAKPPGDESLRKSMKLLQLVYADDYKKAGSPEQRQAVIARMLDQARQVEPGSADAYVLCQTVYRLGIANHDFKSATKSAARLEETFEVDGSKMRLELLREFAQARLPTSELDELVMMSLSVLDQAILHDDFELAREVCELGERVARRTRDDRSLDRIQATRRGIARLQREYHEVEQALLRIADHSHDADASFTIGRYFCFMKGQWERGLPLLAEGAETRFRRLANLELSMPVSPVEQVRLADGWWDAAYELDESVRRNVLEHSLKWYERAVQGLPAGLLQAKVEMRIEKSRRELGWRG